MITCDVLPVTMFFFTTLADPPPPGMVKDHTQYGFFSEPIPYFPDVDNQSIPIIWEHLNGSMYMQVFIGKNFVRMAGRMEVLGTATPFLT